MKGRHLLILLALVIVLGGAGYYLQKGNQTSWSSSSGGAGGKVLDFPINEVVTARIHSKDGEVNLVNKGDQWTVRERADYPANFELVGPLLRKFWELKTVQEVKVGASQLPRLELVEPGKGENSGTLIEFKDKDGKNLSALLLGKRHLRKGESGPMGGEGFPAGRYVMPIGSTKVSLVSDNLDDADPKPERWLRRDFIKVESPVAISVNGQTEAMRWKLTRESATADWKLPDAKPEEALDTNKASAFGTLFGAPSFKDVLPPDAKPEDTGLDKPTTVTIETADAFTYTLQIGKVTNEAYPTLVSVSANLPKERTPAADEKPEDKERLDSEFQAKQKRLEEKLTAEKKFEGRGFLLEKYTVEPLLKDRAGLLAEKKPDPATTPAPAESAPATPPGSATTPPVSVTTPPVSVPPAPPAPPAGEPPATPAPPATTPAPAPPSNPPPAEPPQTPPPSPPAPAPVPPAPTPNPEPTPPAPPAPEPKPSGDPAPASPPPAPPAPAPADPAPAPVPPPPVPAPTPPAPSPAPANPSEGAPAAPPAESGSSAAGPQT